VVRFTRRQVHLEDDSVAELVRLLLALEPAVAQRA
jgi:hypothetical protein